jgi:hypothetical protein
MGILDKLNKLATDDKLKTLSPNGSIYAPNYVVDGAYPTSKLAGGDSSLHAGKDGKEGYSLNGEGVADVTALYNAYDDGVVNALPKPSILDNANNDPNFVPTYNSTKTYTDNRPEKPTPTPAP